MSKRSARLRIVVDTNLFVSATINKLGQPRRLLLAWYARRFDVLVSDSQRAELVDVFGRPRIVVRYGLTAEELTELFDALNGATLITPSPSIPVSVRDVKDEHILAPARGGGADYLVSGDKDLLVLAGDPRLGALKIVTVAEFLSILDRDSSATRR
jgi:putative PIN family toxin of toxin-antitoxin system